MRISVAGVLLLKLFTAHAAHGDTAPKPDELVDTTSYPPRVVDSSTIVHIAPDGQKNGKTQYRLNLTMNMVGKTEPDDRIRVQLTKGGAKVGKPFECAVGEHDYTTYSYVNDFDCRNEAMAMEPGEYRADLVYLGGGSSASGPKPTPWRTIAFRADPVWETIKIKGVRANLDHKLDEGWVTLGGGQPQYLELVFWSAPKKQDPPSSVAARCFLGEKQIGSTVTRLDADREVSVSDAKTQEFLGYTRYSVRGFHIALRPRAPSPGDVPDTTTTYLSQTPGNWECRLNIDGKVTRVWRFAVGENGQIATQAAPDNKPIVSPFKLVAIDVKGDYDRPVQRKPAARYAFFGR